VCMMSHVILGEAITVPNRLSDVVDTGSSDQRLAKNSINRRLTSAGRSC
jgi:hypothetical protein